MKIPKFILKRAGKKGPVQMQLIGLCLGVTLGIAFVPILDYNFDCGAHHHPSSDVNPSSSENKLSTPLVVQKSQQDNNNNPIISSKLVRAAVDNAKLKRPRYFSTELGLRRKLLVGIILSDSHHLENLVAINQTLSRSKVDKFLFFIGGSQSPTILKQLKNVGLSSSVVVQVPGTETNDASKVKGPETYSSTSSAPVNLSTTDNHHDIDYNLVALKVIKYFGDKFFDKFDYFAIFLENYYINGRLLAESVSQMSVSQEVLWGLPSSSGNSCALEPGFVISRKIVQKLSSKIERCSLNPALKLDSNLSKCLDILLQNGKYFCESLAQRTLVLYSSFPVHATPDKLKIAITVGPTKDSAEIYEAHGKISLLHYSEIQDTIHQLQNKIQTLIPSLPLKYQFKSTWPLGISRGSVPKTRFEVIKWTYFDAHHLYGKTEVSTINSIEGIDKQDLDHVINSTISMLITNSATNPRRGTFSSSSSSSNNNRQFYFHGGYRRLNPSRGMEYILDFKESNYNNSTTNIIRVEGIRPLCKTELLSMPYVTENRRVNIIVPVTAEHNTPQIRNFLDRFFDFTVDKKLNTIVILALIIKKSKDNTKFQSKDTVSSDSLKMGTIQEIKSLTSYYNGKASQSSMTDGAKVGYIIIPSFSSSDPFKNTNGYITTIDAVIKRILGSSALILTVDVHISLKDEFVNRVRMNTIMNWQAFSPIPFLEYNPSVYQPLHNNKNNKISANHNNPASDYLVEVSKNSGYFDTSDYRYFSFFAADYAAARKSANASLLSELERLQDFSALEQLFLRVSPLHILRAPDPNLKVPFSFPSGCSSFQECAKRNWGSRFLLAKTIFASRHNNNNNKNSYL